MKSGLSSSSSYLLLPKKFAQLKKNPSSLSALFSWHSMSLLARRMSLMLGLSSEAVHPVNATCDTMTTVMVIKITEFRQNDDMFDAMRLWRCWRIGQICRCVIIHVYYLYMSTGFLYNSSTRLVIDFCQKPTQKIQHYNSL